MSNWYSPPTNRDIRRAEEAKAAAAEAALKHIFTVYSEGDTPVVEGTGRGLVTATYPTLEAAIRTWDRISNDNPGTIGGVMIQSFAGEVMVRDGWILKTDGQRVWLNPNLALA